MRPRVADVDEGPMSLLEVVPNDLVCAVTAVQAARRELMQVGSFRLRDAAVRDIADEYVMEGKDLIAGVDECALGQVGQDLIRSRCLSLWRQVVELVAAEAAPDDGRAAKHGEPSRIKTVQPACEQRLDCRGCLFECEVGGFHRECEKLFRKEWVAPSLIDDASFDVRIDR